MYLINYLVGELIYLHEVYIYVVMRREKVRPYTPKEGPRTGCRRLQRSWEEQTTFVIVRGRADVYVDR